MAMIQNLAKAENRSVSSYLRHVLTVSNILPGCSDTGRPKRNRSIRVQKAA
jgi:hypothetical protein